MSSRFFWLGVLIWVFAVLSILVGRYGENEVVNAFLVFSIVGANLMIVGIGLKTIFDK